MTGATGFLGSRLLARLHEEPNRYDITILKRSFSDTRRITSLLARVKVFDLDKTPLPDIFVASTYDAILHCATDYGRKEVARAGMIETNLLLPLRLLEMGSCHGVWSFINTDTMLDKGVSAYALSKLQFRDWLKHYSDSVNATTVALEHFYGPGDDETKFVSHIVKCLLQGVPQIPLTLGAQQRDFIYIDDVVAAFMCILNETKRRHKGYSEYEVGSGTTISIREFVSMAKELCQNNVTRLDFGGIPYRSNEAMAVHVNTARLRALGWRPLVSLEEGLRRTIESGKAILK